MQEKIEYIYLRFFSVKSVASWLISTWTRQWPSHVEFMVGPGQYFGSDIDVGVSYVDDEYYKKITFKHIEYYKIPVTAYQKEQIMKIAFAEEGKDYDILALIGNLFSRNWQYSEKWFCSELIGYAAERGGKALLDYRTNRITPGDLLKSDLLIQCDEKDVNF